MKYIIKRTWQLCVSAYMGTVCARQSCRSCKCWNVY